MKRQFGDNSESFDEDDDEIERLEQAYIEAHMVPIDLEVKMANLSEAISIAQRDLFWWFRSPDYKVRAIKSIYEKLRKIILKKEKL